MSHITIKIETENDAFHPLQEFETARILRELADRIETNSEITTIRDVNGNKVGEYNVYK